MTLVHLFYKNLCISSLDFLLWPIFFFDGYVTIIWVTKDKNYKYYYYNIGVERWVNMEINDPTSEPYLEDI